MSPLPSATRLQPTRPDERVALLDVLRGFALTGVLLVNMMSYGAYDDRWSGPVDRYFRLIEYFVFEHRFWHLFSLLFGLGFAVQYARASAKGAGFVPLYLRRLLLLFGFGAVSNVLWRVDILTDYAVLGLLLIPLRRWSARAVLVAAACAQLAPAAIGAVRAGLEAPGDGAPEVATAPPAPATGAEGAPTWAEEEHRLRAQGAFGEVVAAHARRYVEELRNPDLQPSLGNWWGYFAMFLLGLYVGKRELLHDYRRHRGLIRGVGWVGLFLGFMGVGFATWREFAGASLASWPLAAQALTEALVLVGYTGMMCFYVYVVSAWSVTDGWAWLRRGFAAVGRTALSNYLLQALLINVIFMGWGFGRYDRWGPTATMLASVPIYLCLTAASVWWVARFRYGPAEWLWRTLTYGRLQPMRVPAGQKGG